MKFQEISEGLTKDFDLTIHGDFQKGAIDPGLMKVLSPGTLPWNEKGEIHQPKKSYNDEFDYDEFHWNILLNESFSIINNDLDMIDIISYDDSPKKSQLSKLSKKLLEKVAELSVNGLSEDPKEVLKWLKAGLELSLKGDMIILKNKDSVVKYYQKYNSSSSMISYPVDISRWITTTDDVGWSNQSFTVNTTNTYKITEAVTDFTPLRFRGVSISNDEIDEKVLIMDRGENLKLKNEKLRYIQAVKKIFMEWYRTPIKDEMETCAICGKRYLLFSDTLTLPTKCPECASIRKYDSPKYSDLMREDVFGHDEKITHEDSDILSSPYMAFSFLEPEIDFAQPVYDDRGVWLLRRPRNSFELQVQLGKDTEPEIHIEDEPYQRKANLVNPWGNNIEHVGIIRRALNGLMNPIDEILVAMA